jgi:hypothetical protein
VLHSEALSQKNKQISLNTCSIENKWSHLTGKYFVRSPCWMRRLSDIWGSVTMGDKKMAFSSFLFCFWWYWVWTQGRTLARQMLYYLSHSASPFLCGFFWDRVSWTICPGWPQTKILLISASWVARITEMSHWCPEWHLIL